MRDVWLLRIALYAQLFLGVVLISGGAPPIRDLHLGLGLLAGVLALIALRPVPGVPVTTVRQLGRFFPLVPLAIGLGIRFGGLLATAGAARVVVILLHVVLGFAAIGIVEAAAGQQRRALLATGGDSLTA